MRLPLSLLKSFLSLDMNVEKCAEILTLLGIEVDAIHSPKPSFSRVVVAEVKSVARHPSADKLQVAEVWDGAHTYQVVCGAPNCRAGLRVAFARIGAILTEENGALRTIEKTAIRGVESMGMLCSAAELGLYEDHVGILELPREFILGEECLPLWDPILELSFTPNLGHCMSALGVARELSAALQKPLQTHKFTVHESSAQHIDKLLEVSVWDPSICPRYTARLISNIVVGPSPFWLQKILKSAGIRPINNVVDATNYMLLKNGQPMHAFDFDKIEGSRIEVSLAEEPRTFVGLDQNSYEAPKGTLLIADERKILALGGILGGASSAVTDGTQTILLEAAAFDPLTVRLGAKKMGIRTDSSQRFEKGVDPSAVHTFLDEAAELIAQIAGGKVAAGSIDTHKGGFIHRAILCRIDRVNQILGTQLSESEIESILHRLEFGVKKEGSGRLLVAVPHYRNDVHEEIDLIEEVARIYGYNNIERPLPKATTPQIPHDPAYLFETELRRRLVALGLQEFITCDLISPKLAAIAQEIADPTHVLFQTLHSKSEEYSILRPTLLPGLLQTVRHNLDQKNRSFTAFELGRIHFQQLKPTEIPMAAIISVGKSGQHHWDRKPSDVDFFDLKGLIENLLIGLRIPAFSFIPSKHSSFHPSRQADLYLNSLFIGTLGQLHPTLLAKLGIEEPVYYAELNAQHLQTHQGPPPHMVPLPQFPSSERDWTLPLPQHAHIGAILEAIRASAPPILESFSLIDLFQTEEKKNATLRFVYRDRSKTLSFEEVEAAHAQLVNSVAKQDFSSRSFP